MQALKVVPKAGCADSDPSQVRVIAKNKVDDRFTDLMEKETKRFDLRMDKLDASHVGKRDESLGIKVFLKEALSSKAARDHQRRANMLGGGHQGSTAPLGLAVDHILYQKQQAAEFAKAQLAAKRKEEGDARRVSHIKRSVNKADSDESALKSRQNKAMALRSP